LSGEAIDMMIECFDRCPSPHGDLLLEHVHGAATRVGVEATACLHRAVGYNFLALGQWMDAAGTERCIGCTRATYDAMQPFAAARRYVNYLGADEPQEAQAAAYGPNHRRLQQLKASYDPANFFHMNQNVLPIS
jgi:hypothetical protein